MQQIFEHKFDNNEVYRFIANPDEDTQDFFQIEKEANIEIYPKKLISKYYGINEFSIDALVNNYLYASHPKELNDPFDCSPDLFDYEILRNEVLVSHKLLGKEVNVSLLQDDKDNILLNQLIERIFMSRIGIISMTFPDNKSSVWSHYAQNKGFKIDFKADLLHCDRLNGPFKIHYCNKIQKISLEEAKVGAQILYRNLLKDINWNNEEEWRWFFIGEYMSIPRLSESHIEKNNRKYYYPFDAIDSITLGFYFFDPTKWEEISENKEYIYRFQDDEYLKIKLLSYLSRKELTTKILVLNPVSFQYEANKIEFDLRLETNSIWFKVLS